MRRGGKNRVMHALEMSTLQRNTQMVIGITMVKVVPGLEKACYEALMHAVGIKEIYHLFGEYDFFLILEAADKMGLIRLLKEIRGWGYVLDTWSLLVSDYESHPAPVRTFSMIRNSFNQEMADATDATAVNALLTNGINSRLAAGNVTSA